MNSEDPRQQADEILDDQGISPPHPYEETSAGLVMVKHVLKGKGESQETVPQSTPLTNFTARITSDVAVDDGTEVRREFEITASVNGRSARFTVPAERFAGMTWVTEHLGASAIVRAGMGLKDHARVAIQYLSGEEITRRHVYAHTGWRRLAGGWGYLTASGALMAAGLDTSVTVDIGPLAGYSLPDVPGLPALRQAVCASLSILEVAPDQGRCRCSVRSTGRLCPCRPTARYGCMARAAPSRRRCVLSPSSILARAWARARCRATGLRPRTTWRCRPSSLTAWCLSSTTTRPTCHGPRRRNGPLPLTGCCAARPTTARAAGCAPTGPCARRNRPVPRCSRPPRTCRRRVCRCGRG
jgi:hypothetical protein